MPIVRIEHSVASFEKWKQAFDSDPANRKGSEAFLTTMRRIWDGPGKSVMKSPQARIAQVVESQEL